MDYSFPKSERVCGVTTVKKLFNEGEGFMSYPFKCVFTKSDCCESSSIKVLFSVGKKYSKSAVKRNKVKRRSREAFRLNKRMFYDQSKCNVCIEMAFIYVAKKEEEYTIIENGIKKALTIVATKISANIDIHSASVNKIL